MSSIVTVIEATDRASESRVVINDNFAARHAWDIRQLAAGDSPYAVVTADQLLLVDASAGAVQITLPAAAGFGHRSLYVVVKSVAGGLVTVVPAAFETIDGQTSLQLSAAYTAARIVSDGSEWFRI